MAKLQQTKAKETEQEQHDCEAYAESKAAEDEQQDMMREVLGTLGFSEGAADALIDDQLLTRHEVLHQLDDPTIADLCKAVHKPGGGGDGHPIPEMAVQRLQLLVFYYKHLDQIQMKFNPDWVTIEALSKLKDQKILEQNWIEQNPEHKLEPMQLDMLRATQAFNQAMTILRRIWGVTKVPLAYVVCHRIIPNNNFFDCLMSFHDTMFKTYNEEMEAWAPIIDIDNYDKNANDETLERDGPFTISFLSDTKKAWTMLHALWSMTLAWAHVKMLDKTQNGRQVYHTLHKHFFGGNKVVTHLTNILLMVRVLPTQGTPRTSTLTSMSQTMFSSTILLCPSLTMGGLNLTSILRSTTS